MIFARKASAQERTLKVVHWKHFVPDYDKYFDVFAKEFGEKTSPRSKWTMSPPPTCRQRSPRGVIAKARVRKGASSYSADTCRVKACRSSSAEVSTLVHTLARC
jgi:hypothetical protein